MKPTRSFLVGIMAAALPVYSLSVPASPGEYVQTHQFVSERLNGSTAYLEYRITYNGIILEINDGTDISRRILFLRYIPDETGRLVACLLTIRYMTFNETVSNDYIPDPGKPDFHTAWVRNKQGRMELISPTGEAALDNLDIEREFDHLRQECLKHAKLPIDSSGNPAPASPAEPHTSPQ